MKNGAKKSIGIIGAGASGMVSAWLLENEYDVILFEKEERLGGHVDTIPVTMKEKTVMIEAGAEFFSDTMFPTFNRLLACLAIPTHPYPLSYTFYNTITGQTLLLPPIKEQSISWESLSPPHLSEMLQLTYLIERGTAILSQANRYVTFGAFLESLALPSAFIHDFLYPFIAAGWGVPPQEIASFAAYDILYWIISHQPSGIEPVYWKEIPGGMSRYIEALAHQLRNTTIYTGCPVTSIQKNGAGYSLHTATGKEASVDYLIVATNAHQATQLLSSLPDSHRLQEILKSIEYFKTTIAIHGDRRFMPAEESDWSTANIRHDGIHSALTISKPWMRELPVFRSWITYSVGLPSHTLPEPLYALRHYHHPKVTAAYFAAQDALIPLQGENNLWIAGFYTTGPDSHNSAILSATLIAQTLAPHEARLKKLTS